jgi:hypothetical protein
MDFTFIGEQETIAKVAHRHNLRAIPHRLGRP